MTASLQASGGLQGLVLCLSSSGHFAIEAAHVDPNCAPTCNTADAKTDDSGEWDETTHPCCVDVMLARVDYRSDRRSIEQEQSSEHSTDAIAPSAEFVSSISIRGPTATDARSVAAFDEAKLDASRLVRTFILRT